MTDEIKQVVVGGYTLDQLDIVGCIGPDLVVFRTKEHALAFHGNHGSSNNRLYQDQETGFWIWDLDLI